jgi:hypothetical protein
VRSCWRGAGSGGAGPAATANAGAVTRLDDRCRIRKLAAPTITWKFKIKANIASMVISDATGHFHEKRYVGAWLLLWLTTATLFPS